MKVHRKTIIHAGSGNLADLFGRDWRSIEFLTIKWCCKKAEQELIKMHNGHIGISRPGWEGETDEQELDYCPWCGEEIIYFNDKTVRRIIVPTEKTVTDYSKYIEEEIGEEK